MSYRVSLHEAGHAVAATVLGFHVVELTNSPGCCVFTGGFELRPGEWLVEVFAGQLAEWRDFPTQATEEGGKADRERAKAILTSHPELDVRHAWRRAQELVDRHWQQIEAVADALTVRGSLDGGEVARICGCHDT